MTRVGQSPNIANQQRIGNPPPQQQAGDKLQTVKRGDTLSHIARENNISTRDIIAANPQIQDPNKIWPGDMVRIPNGNPEVRSSEQTTPNQTTTPTQTPVNPHQNDSYSTGADPGQNILPQTGQNSPGVSGDVWNTQLDNGTNVSVLGGSITPDGNGGVDARGHLLELENDGVRVGVGDVRIGGADEISQERVNISRRVDATAISSTTGDNNTVDIGSKIGDVGGEATFHVEADGSEGRIGAGYRANVAEVNGGLGSVTAENQNDFRQEVRVAAGAPSGGAFVSWGDRDNDGATNYRLDVDVPIPGTPLGVGVSYETEKPIQDGLGVLGLMNPVTAPIAGGYLLGRALKFW